MLTRNRGLKDGRTAVQTGMPDKLRGRQEHCTVQTRCPNDDVVLVGAPSSDLLSLRQPVFPSLLVVV